MKCDFIIERYLRLEDNSHIPLFLRFHIFFCSECRKEISAMKNLFVDLKNDSSYKSQYDLSPSIMDRIRRENVYYVKTISGLKWVTIGLIIFFSMLLLNFSESFLWIKNEFGSNYTLPTSIVLGFILTAYSTILIGCNYEYIKKYIDMHSKWKFKE